MKTVWRAWWMLCGVLVWVSGCSSMPDPQSPCEAVACGLGRCVAADGATFCVCDDGAVTRDGRCVAATEPDPCDGDPCSGLPFSTCVTDGGATRCVCGPSRVEVDGRCVVRTPCTPNPCTTEHQTLCEPSDGTALCRCEDGYAPEDGGCVLAPGWDCSVMHGGDSAESDECPARASAIFPDARFDRTLSPAGDHDWFRIGVTPGHIFTFFAEGARPLLVDVYTLAGVSVGGDSRGSTSGRADFVVPEGAVELLVRVRAVSSADTDVYAASYTERGPDDFANTPEQASQLSTSTGVFQGELQYPGDLDVVSLELPSNTANDFFTDAGVARFEFTTPDGGSKIFEEGRFSVTVPSLTRLALAARARDERSLGPFSLGFVALGADDHSEDVRFATPLAANSSQPGRLERGDDRDTFVIEQRRNHVYRVSFSGSGDVRVSGFSGDGSQLFAPWTLEPQWKSARDGMASLTVRAYPAQQPVAQYHLHLQDRGPDDHGDTVADARPVTLAIATAGKLEFSEDADVFAFTATAGHIITATCGFVGAVAVSILDASGAVVATDTTATSFVPSVSGTWYVKVHPSFTSTNYPALYSLVVRDLGADDHGDVTSPTPVTAGGSTAGSIQYRGDLDTFSLTPVPRHVYRITCVTQGSCGLTATGSNGPLGFAPDGTALTFMAPDTSPVLISIGTSNNASLPLAYALSVVDLGAEDHGETRASASPLPLSTATAGSILWNYDVDVFALSSVVGHGYTVEVTSSAGIAGLRVEDPTGAVVSNGVNRGSFLAEDGGVFAVYVTNTSSFSGPNNYTITATDRGLDDHGNTVGTATLITLPANATATAQYEGDLDTFVFSTTPGRFYEVNTGSCTGMVFAPEDALVSQVNTNAGRMFKAPLGAVTARLEVSSTFIPRTCTVLVTEGPADDHGDTVSTATPLAVDDAGVPGTLQSSADADAFSVVLTAQEIVVFESDIPEPNFCSLTMTTPTGSAGGSLFRCRGGMRVTDTGRWHAIMRDSNTLAPVPYVLSARRVVDEVGDTAATATPLVAGVQQTAAIQYAGDLDAYSVTLTANVSYPLLLTGGVRADLKLNGAQVRGFVGSTSPVNFSVTTSGTYTLIVGHNLGSTPTAYTVQWQ